MSKARLVEVGKPFKVDMKERSKLMREDKVKILRHNLGVIWKGLFIDYKDGFMVIGWVIGLIVYITLWEAVTAYLTGIDGVGSSLGIVSIIVGKVVWVNWLSPAFNSIRRNWKK